MKRPAALRFHDVGTRRVAYIQRSADQARMYTLGNSPIARTMLRHDLAFALDVPVRLMIYEHRDGDVRLTYDLPSSLMSHLKSADVQAAAEKLDAKLGGLAASVTAAVA